MAVDGALVLDAVAHSYNLSRDNYDDPDAAEALAGLAWALASDMGDERYSLPEDVYRTDWSVDDTAAILFGESDTDFAIIHPLPIYAFKDGLSSIEKAAETLEKYPHRFLGGYACIDPLRGKEALDSMERQVEMLNPLGIKLYPTSWHDGVVRNWHMDDPEIAFPVFEKARELGVDHIAIHKAVPSGLVPIGDAYGAKDVEAAAFRFPDLTFEIVHGGLAFVEETAIIMARHQNVWINLEIWNVVLARRPRVFARMFTDLLNLGGMPIVDRLLWGQGSTLVHPRPGLEAFMEFQIPDDLLEGAGMFGPLEQLTPEHKRQILGGNYARMHGLDLEAAAKKIEGDQFSREPGQPLPEPFSTTSKSQVAA